MAIRFEEIEKIQNRFLENNFYSKKQVKIISLNFNHI